MDHRGDFPSNPHANANSDPLVDEMSILEVVTQSARGKAAASQMMERTYSGDETVLDILADLVRDGDVESENDEDEVDREEGDANDNDEEDELETLEMTQVWSQPYEDIENLVTDDLGNDHHRDDGE